MANAAGGPAGAGPALVPGLRAAGLTAAALTLLGVAIALTLRRPATAPATPETERQLEASTAA